MHSSVLTLGLFALASCSEAGFVKHSIRQNSDTATPADKARHAAAKHARFPEGSHRYAVQHETLDAGFWYGTFDVGEAKDLSLLIDTGSSDVAVNPDLYKPSPHSENLHEKGQLSYATAQENGCGKSHVYSLMTTLFQIPFPIDSPCDNALLCAQMAM